VNGAKPTLASPWSTDPAPPASLDPVSPGPPGLPGPADRLDLAEAADASRQPWREAQAGAVYTVEAPVLCPHCDAEIRSFRVLRLLRTQVSFTSTLPRKGYVITCPECRRLLSAELSGLV